MLEIWMPTNSTCLLSPHIGNVEPFTTCPLKTLGCVQKRKSNCLARPQGCLQVGLPEVVGHSTACQEDRPHLSARGPSLKVGLPSVDTGVWETLLTPTPSGLVWVTFENLNTHCVHSPTVLLFFTLLWLWPSWPQRIPPPSLDVRLLFLP